VVIYSGRDPAKAVIILEFLIKYRLESVPKSVLKNMKNFIRKLTKISKHSFYIVIPKEIIAKYSWRERQKLVIVDKGRGRLEIRDWRKR